MNVQRAGVIVVALLAASGNGLAAAVEDDTPIAALQGPGTSSPLAGRRVRVTGIVTGDFQDYDQDRSHDLGGFYLMSATPDEDPRTSEGIFVYEGSLKPADVAVGERVQVEGEVKEHFGETQLLARGIVRQGRGKVRATDIELPAAAVAGNANGESIADLERYEGMLVSLPQVLTVTDLHELERFGSLALAANGRLAQFTNIARPGREAYQAHVRANAARTIILDDGRREQNPGSLRWLMASGGEAIRSGDRFRGLTGNLRYARGSGASGTEGWRIMPMHPAEFERANPRPAPPVIDGRLRVASFNVLNYFSGIDTGAPACGPRARQGCRGADSEAEQTRQLAKIVTTLVALDADIVGLLELENNARDSLADIVDALNEKRGKNAYAYVDTGTVGHDAIKTGLLYRPGTVAPAGDFALLGRRVDPRFDDRRNRPALAQTFVDRQGAALTVVVNHLKSKGSPCDEAGDPNTGDGQAHCNLTRSRAAAALVDWLERDPTASGDPDVLLDRRLQRLPRGRPPAGVRGRGLREPAGSRGGRAVYLRIRRPGRRARSCAGEPGARVTGQRFRRLACQCR